MTEIDASIAKPRDPRTLRDVAQDQLLNGFVGQVCSRSRPLKRVVNRLLIDEAINTMPPRPYALSTKHEYTSWESLTDRTFCARELPAPRSRRARPPLEDVIELFRRDTFKPSDKSTVLFAYFAQWFTDGFLRSPRLDANGKTIQPRDLNHNDSTNHVDLAQVYGPDAQVTNGLRDGRRLAFQEIDGEQYPPPLFAGDGARVKRFEPLATIGIDDPRADLSEFLAMASDAANTQIGYAMLNTLYLRAHNTVADLIAAREKGLSDERIFHTTRNVLIVLTIKLVIEEYINHIAPWRFRFAFDQGGFEKARWHRQNWVAVEFNVLYRWHCLIPPKLVVHGQERALGETLFRTRSLLTQGDGLGGLLHDASRQHAGAIELFNTGPELLERAERQTLDAARRVGLGSYNDYRRHAGFRPIRRFEDISSDGRVVEALQRVYRDVDEIEFYPGLFAEDRPSNAVVPGLMGRMVAVHAFSQLLTNPLLAPSVYNAGTFTATGLELIETTDSIQALVDLVGMKGFAAELTHTDWVRHG